MSADVPLLQLCCLAGNKAAGGPSVKEKVGCDCLNNSPIYSPVPAELERLAETLSCCESRVTVQWRCQYPRLGADSSQNPIGGLVVQSPTCCALTRHRNKLDLWEEHSLGLLRA